jgi:hypothetical protein
MTVGVTGIPAGCVDEFGLLARILLIDGESPCHWLKLAIADKVEYVLTKCQFRL